MMERQAAELRHPLTVRVYGDSLGLPREDVGVAPEDTYAERFKAALALMRNSPVLLFNRSRGGATVDVLHQEFLNDGAYFGHGTRGVLVVQCGIVDCAPRPIPRWLRSTLSRLPGHVRAPIVRLLHANRGRLLRVGLSWRLTPPGRFRREIYQWLAAACGEVDEIYVLTIAPTNEETETHSPGLTASIERYNALLVDIVEELKHTRQARIAIVDVHAAITASRDTTSSCVSPSDGHHITAAGHALYASQLAAAAKAVVLLQESGGFPTPGRSDSTAAGYQEQCRSGDERAAVPMKTRGEPTQ